MLVHRRDMIVIVTHREQPAMHFGVKRLYPPVHHLRKTGEVGNILHLMAKLAEPGGSAAGRNQFHSLGGKRRCQLFEAGLVGQGNERAADRHDIGHETGESS